MTDLEISKALAHAIGWKTLKLYADGTVGCWVGDYWRTFDYRSPDVIWPIAKRIGFPSLGNEELWAVSYWGPSAKTPEKAVAMAAIGTAI